MAKAYHLADSAELLAPPQCVVGFGFCVIPPEQYHDMDFAACMPGAVIGKRNRFVVPVARIAGTTAGARELMHQKVDEVLDLMIENGDISP
jgi:hypothetical protein